MGEGIGAEAVDSWSVEFIDGTAADDLGPPVVPGGQEIGLGSQNLGQGRRHVA